MHRESDVCIVVEGGYPYSIGGVATWLDSFLRSFPHMQFHIVTIRVSTTGRTPKYPRPDNVVDITDINIDQCPAGRAPTRADRPAILSFAAQMQRLLSDPDPSVFAQLMLDMQRSGLGRVALLDTRAAWQGMERAYNAIAPNAPLVDFFWTWRNFATCIIALASAPLPRAKSYHALATGYSGLFGARAKALTQRPFVIPNTASIQTNDGSSLPLPIGSMSPALAVMMCHRQPPSCTTFGSTLSGIFRQSPMARVMSSRRSIATINLSSAMMEPLHTSSASSRMESTSTS